MSPTVAWDQVGNIFVVCHGAESATEEEWAEVIGEMRKSASELDGVLVFTAGAGVSAVQRQDIQSVLDGTDIKVAVLTESRLVRGAVTALSWFKIPIRAFPHEDTGGALEHLGAQDSKAVIARLRQLRSRVA